MIVYLSYFYGLRVSECSKLTVSDIDFHNRYIYIIDSKGRKDRVLPLIEPAMSMLETYIRGALPKIMNDKIKPRSVDRRRADSTKQYLFPAMYSKSRMNKQPLQRVFLRAVKNAGINRPLTFHCLRYSFATNILHRGMGIRYAQMIMGHEDINSTGRYTKVLTDDLRRALKQYHPREQKAASVINGIKAGGYECTGLYSKISGKPEKRQLQQEIN
jgi:site-specific recombinase XerD